MTSREMKTAIIAAVLIAMAIFNEGKTIRRYRRNANELHQSYIVHYNSRGEPLNVAGFEDFIRVLNGQRGPNAASLSASSSGEKFEDSSPLGAGRTAPGSSEMTTKAETTVTTHQPEQLAAESSTPSSATAGTASPESASAVANSTEALSEVPREFSGPISTTEASVSSTDKTPLILAFGHDAAATNSVLPPAGRIGGSFSSDLTKFGGVDFALVTPGEYSPSKMSFSNFGFPHGASLAASKLISLQPRVQTLLNYAPSSSLALRDYLPTVQTSYVQALSAPLQRPYAQTETASYASYPTGENTPMFLRQSSQLIDIGQGLGQGYRSPPQELPINLGSWGGDDHGGRSRGVNNQPKNVFGIAKFGYTMPYHSPSLSKIGFGPGSW